MFFLAIVNVLQLIGSSGARYTFAQLHTQIPFNQTLFPSSRQLVSYSKINRMKTACNIIVFLLVLLFAYTGASKLAGHDKFIYQLSRVHFFDGYVRLTSWIIPAAELFTALLLCIRFTRTVGLWISLVLMCSLVVYVATVLSGTSLPCSCGGVIAAMTWQQHLYFNIIFLALNIIALIGNNAYMYLGSKLKTRTE